MWGKYGSLYIFFFLHERKQTLTSTTLLCLPEKRVRVFWPWRAWPRQACSPAECFPEGNRPCKAVSEPSAVTGSTGPAVPVEPWVSRSAQSSLQFFLTGRRPNAHTSVWSVMSHMKALSFTSGHAPPLLSTRIHVFRPPYGTSHLGHMCTQQELWVGAPLSRPVN